MNNCFTILKIRLCKLLICWNITPTYLLKFEPQIYITLGAFYFTGNRGLNYEHFNQTRFGFSDLTNLWNLYSNASDYSTSVIDHFYFQEDGWDSYSTRTHGYFVPPHTGDYTLHIKSDDEAILFFSMDEDPANKVFMSILMLKLFTTDFTNYHNSVVMFYKNIYLFFVFFYAIALCPVHLSVIYMKNKSVYVQLLHVKGNSLKSYCYNILIRSFLKELFPLLTWLDILFKMIDNKSRFILWKQILLMSYSEFLSCTK